MTRKHYAQLATALGNLRAALPPESQIDLANFQSTLIAVLAQANPAFSPSKFIEVINAAEQSHALRQSKEQSHAS